MQFPVIKPSGGVEPSTAGVLDAVSAVVVELPSGGEP